MSNHIFLSPGLTRDSFRGKFIAFFLIVVPTLIQMAIANDAEN